MRLFVVFAVLLVLLGGYAYGLMHTTNMVLTQTQHLNATYQYVANNSEKLATGQ